MIATSTMTAFGTRTASPGARSGESEQRRQGRCSPARRLRRHESEDRHQPQPSTRRGSDRWKLALKIGAPLLVIALLTAAWRFTPLGKWLTVENLVDLGMPLRSELWAGPVVVGCYLAAGLLGIPLNLLFIATIWLFGPWLGAGYAYVGALLSAAVVYRVGSVIGSARLIRHLGPRVRQLRRRVADQRLPTLIIVRILPVAPYSLTNVVAGAVGIRFSRFSLATAVGLLPGLAALMLLADQIGEAIADGSLERTVLIATAVVLLLALGSLAKRRIWRRRAASTPHAGSG